MLNLTHQLCTPMKIVKRPVIEQFVILLVLALPFHIGHIEIIQGPSNVTAYVGESVTLPCVYTGTDNQPKWRIGGVTYTSANLPAGYEYMNEGLRIPSVWRQLNNTTFTCFFTIFVEVGRFREIESDVAFITVNITEIVSTPSAAKIWTTIFRQWTVTPSLPTVASTHRKTILSQVLIILCGVLLFAIVANMRLFRELAVLCLGVLLYAIVASMRLFRKLAWFCLGVPLLAVVTSVCLFAKLCLVQVNPQDSSVATQTVTSEIDRAAEIDATEKNVNVQET